MRRKNFWKTVKATIRDSDMLLLILDARHVKETLNAEIVQKIRGEGKPIIYVVTKADLEPNIEKEDLPKPYVIVSTKVRSGKSALRERILITAEQRYGKEANVRVGVLGYPNVGKSSVINMLKGARSAPVSAAAGYTKSEQFIRVHKKILLIDTPGVIPFGEKDKALHAVTGVLDINKLKDPADTLSKIMERHPGVIESHFGINTSGKIAEDVIEAIAQKKNLIMRGGIPDTARAARMVIAAIQKGKIRL
ncbi:MAG: GTPase [Candidatus Aenigmatarchaeota archaeon]